MSLEQELAHCESLASELNERISSIRAALNPEALVQEPVVKSFGYRLRSLRARKGLTQVGLAEEAGLSINTVIKLENDYTSKPHATTLQRLSRVLDVEERELLNE